MKRSEMIKLMTDTFEFEGLGHEMRVKDANAILFAMERAGMLPPGVATNIYLRSECDYAVISEWEPETNNKLLNGSD